MKQTLTKFQFCHYFKTSIGRGNQFSYEALELLFDYLEELEKDMCQELEFDMVAICCEYQESSIDDLIGEYSIDVCEDADDDERAEAVEKFLSEKTSIVGKTSDSFVFANF